ncbi:hypothetical protein EVAR_61638_1 [Eumeta japonica]|uniref:Uncharacterized protein n=1 Tax=Eumeta variegata TaxID=151549 RepID=A0A4C1Z993_EUMVA|nr:hypothetical protein EVAR_61638_1 [Eumeta japonica]
MEKRSTYNFGIASVFARSRPHATSIDMTLTNRSDAIREGQKRTLTGRSKGHSLSIVEIGRMWYLPTPAVRRANIICTYKKRLPGTNAAGRTTYGTRTYNAAGVHDVTGVGNDDVTALQVNRSSVGG